MSRQPAVAVLGAGGHGKVVVATLRAAGRTVAGCYDDDPGCHGEEVLGVPVRGPLEGAVEDGVEAAVLGIGANRTRRAIAERLDLPWVTVVHPSAVVHESVELDPGTVVFAGAVVQPETTLGRHVIVNTGSSVDHDCRVGDFVHVAPGARLAGGVTVEEGAFFGIGSVAIPGVTVGAWSTLGAGSAAARDVPSGATALGVPARVVRREREDGAR